MSSNNVGHLITKTIITLQHFATLHHTSLSYTSPHLSTLHFLSFTLHYPLITLHYPLITLHYPLITLHHPLITLHHPLITLHHPLITLYYPLITLHYPLITLHYPLITLHYPLIWLNPITFPIVPFHITRHSKIFMFAPCMNDNQTLYYPTNAQYIICRYN